MLQALRIRSWTALDAGIAVFLVLMLTSQIMQRWWIPSGDRFNLIHITLAGLIVVLRFTQQTKGPFKWVLGGVGGGILVLAFTYFWEPAKSLSVRSAIPTNMDFVVGCLLLALVIYLVYRSFGLIFASLGLIAVAYAFLAEHVPAPFTGPPIKAEFALARLSMTSQFTGVIDTVARFVWFVIFWGMLVEVSGAGRVIQHLSRVIGSKLASGPALVAVFGSALVGSLTAAGGSNVAITGSITIPMMKEAGYSGKEAGAIEAAASTASGVTPPIMGVVPFIMADALGVPYLTVLKMVLPIALIWYLSVGVYVLAAGFRHENLRRVTSTQLASERVPTNEVWRSAALFVVPVGGLIWFIVQNIPLSTAVFYAFCLTVVLAIVLRVEKRLDVWWRGIRNSAAMASRIVLAIVVVNVLVDVMNFTGIGFRLGDIVFDFSGGTLLYAGLLVMLFGVILGAGLPPLVVYFVMIVTFKPVFFAFDLPDSVTLFTAFYMGILANISPPTAPAALVATGLSGAGFWETSMESMKIAAAAFFIPFIVLVAPEVLLGAPEIDPVSILRFLLVMGAILLSLSVLSAALAGWLGIRLNLKMRAALSVVPFIMYFGLYNDLEYLLWFTMIASLLSFAAGAFLYREQRQRGLRAVAAGSGPSIESSP